MLACDCMHNFLISDICMLFQAPTINITRDIVIVRCCTLGIQLLKEYDVSWKYILICKEVCLCLSAV